MLQSNFNKIIKLKYPKSKIYLYFIVPENHTLLERNKVLYLYQELVVYLILNHLNHHKDFHFLLYHL